MTRNNVNLGLSGLGRLPSPLTTRRTLMLPLGVEVCTVNMKGRDLLVIKQQRFSEA